ncbi:hypothetical protein E4T47_08953 [Aureobasidium subglaciale]|nr:hypothetical protein E4T47_08953 [Aureobasidium subglaciale]
MRLRSYGVRSDIQLYRSKLIQCEDEQSRRWNLLERPIRTLLEQSTSRKACMIFTDIEYIQSHQRNKLRDTVMMRFPCTPRLFWSRTCSLHNGFFGCDYSLPPATIPYSTHFRLAVKTPKNEGLPDYDSSYGGLSYEWSEMGFLSISTPGWNIMLCFNVPKSFISRLQANLPTMLQDLQGPYALHVPLLEQLAVSFDTSIEYIQGTVASIEKDLTDSANISSDSNSTGASFVQQRKTQLAAMFEISRHASQLVETTQIAADTVERMRIECEAFATTQKGATLPSRARRLAFVHCVIRGLSARAATNEKRLANEQNMLSNMISLHNSEALQQLVVANADSAQSSFGHQGEVI